MAASQAGSRRSSRGPRRRARQPWKRRLKIAGLLGVILFSTGCLVAYGVWTRYLADAEVVMPTIEAKLQALQVPPSEILTTNGTVLYESERVYRKSIPLSQVPPVMQDAMIEAEDRRFREHHGVDFWGLARAVASGAKQGGGSTLTMQLAKRLHSAGEKTISRKLMDMAIAEKMEEEWSKDRILDLYLNQVYFGAGAYGIEAAAETYFGKPASRLTLAQSAMLARCVRRPGDETPFLNYDRALANRDVVLKIMLDDGKITEQQYDAARNEDERKLLAPQHRDLNGRIDRAPYAVADVLRELRSQYPSVRLSDGGYKVYTNIDWDMQRAAESAVAHVVRLHARDRVNNAAFILMDGEGRILALVGGSSFNRNQYDVVTQGHRQPGSSFKPFVYATAFTNGKLDLNSRISNERLVYTDPSTGTVWQPHNDDNRYGGTVSVREALASSINVAAVRTILDVGVGTVVSYAHDVFGFTSDLPEYPSIALGACDVSPVEMAQGYSVFMLRGDRATPFLINKVEGADGGLIGETDPKIARNVLSPTVCDDINVLLRGVVTGGTGTRAAVVPDAHGKTGTTSSNKDAWFCGFANGLVGVGWVGNEQYSKRLKAFVPLPMRRSVFGGTVTAPFWAEVMGAAYQKFHDRYARAENLIVADRFSDRGPQSRAENVVKLDPAPPAGSSMPSPNGSPDQQNPPVVGDPAAVVDGPGHGRSTAPPADLPPAPPDPTLAAPTPTKSPPSSRTATKKVEYVEVRICADSGELATDYCPETVKRRFIKGQEPKRYCHLHRG